MQMNSGSIFHTHTLALPCVREMMVEGYTACENLGGRIGKLGTVLLQDFEQMPTATFIFRHVNVIHDHLYHVYEQSETLAMTWE